MKNNSVLKLIFKESSHHVFSLLFIFILVIGSSFVNIYASFLAGDFAKYFSINNSIDSKLLALILIVFFGKYLIEFYLTFYSLYLSKKMEVNTKQIILDKIIDTPNHIKLGFFKTGDILQRVQIELPLLQGKIVIGSIYFIKDVIFIVIVFVFLSTISLSLSFSLIILISLIYFFNKALSKRIKSVNNAIQSLTSKINSLIYEVIIGKKDIYIYSLQNYLSQRLSKYNTLVTRRSKSTSMLTSLNILITEVILTIFIITVILITRHEHLSAENIVVAGMLIVFLIFPLKDISSYIASLNSINPSVRRINKLLISIESTVEYRKKMPFTIIKGDELSLDIRNLDFYYNSNKIVFSDLNIKFQKGFYLLAGKNGIGKSTLFEIISGILTPQKGNIFLNLPATHQNGKKQDINSYIKLVQQNAFLFDCSVLENIQIIYPHLTNEYINQFLLSYNLTELPKLFGKNGTVGNNGIKISGGERQAVNLLRGIFSDTPVLLLDEIFNNLNESIVTNLLQLLKNERNDKLTVITAHNFHNLDFFDCIINLDNKILN